MTILDPTLDLPPTDGDDDDLTHWLCCQLTPPTPGDPALCGATPSRIVNSEEIDCVVCDDLVAGMTTGAACPTLGRPCPGMTT